jgi:hypothetical protein
MNDQLKAIAAPSGALEVAEQLALLHAAALDPKTVGEATFVMIPSGFTHQDVTAAIEKAQNAPNRKRGTVALKDIPSFVDYLKDQAADSIGIVYADPDARTITAVLNDHRASTTGWRDHRATFKAEYTPEFERWLANNGSKSAKDQTAFAEFIEDNMADIADPEAQQAARCRDHTPGDDRNRVQERQALAGRADPAHVQRSRRRARGLGWRFDDPEGIRPRRAHLQERRRLPHPRPPEVPPHRRRREVLVRAGPPERAVEDAFAGYVGKVREGSGYTVVLGAAG